MHSFDILMPKSLEQAASLLPTDPGPSQSSQSARLLAGGQDLVGELKDHLATPKELVNLKAIDGLDQMEWGDGSLRLGALVKVADLEESGTQRRLPGLAEAASSVASPQVRSQATVGGNLCQRPRCWYYRNEHTVCLKKGGTECFSLAGMNKYNAILGGGPSYFVHPSDLAPMLVALDAEVEIQGTSGTRQTMLEDFYRLPSDGDPTRENVLGSNEILTAVNVPLEEGWTSTYLKFKEKSSYDFALASVALAARMDGDRIEEARLVLGGVAPLPWRVRAAEELLAGRRVNERLCAEVGEEALRGAQPLAHNAYKVPLTQGLVTKALRKLARA